MKKYVSTQNELIFPSFDEKCKCKPEWICQCHEKFDEDFFFKFGEMCFESKWKVVKWVKSWFLKHKSVSQFKFCVCEWKFSWMDVRSYFPDKKYIYVFTPGLLSHSPKENDANEAQMVKRWGLYTLIERKVGQNTPKY